MDKLKILVVDDETRMRKLVKDFLVKNNYDVVEAEDGEKAVDIFFNSKEPKSWIETTLPSDTLSQIISTPALRVSLTFSLVQLSLTANSFISWSYSKPLLFLYL